MQLHRQVPGDACRRKRARNSVGLLPLLLSLYVLAGTALAAADETSKGGKAEAEGSPVFGDIVADRNGAGLFGFEYRAGPELELLWVRPSIGVMATMDRSTYGWLGLNVDLPLGPLVLTASTSAGIYGEGDGQDLGSLFVARNGAEIAWRFANEVRLGVGFHYYSNYGTGNEDPGVAAATLVYSHPLRVVTR